MKRIGLYGLILLLALLAPVQRLDVAKLRPVEVIYVYRAQDQVVLQTDTGDLGIGSDALLALADMRKTSPAVIYLDTAEFLLIGEDAARDAEALRGELKDGIKVCRAVGELDLQLTARFLAVQEGLPALRSWNEDTRLPQIYTEKERIKMLKKNEKTA